MKLEPLNMPMDPRFADPSAPECVRVVIPSEHLRCAAGLLGIYLCGGDFGAPVFMAAKELDPSDPQRPAFGDPVYEWVTLHLQEDNREQRKRGATWIFSSCAYSEHMRLELMGWRFPWLGRGTRKKPRMQPINRITTSGLCPDASMRLDPSDTRKNPTFSSWQLFCGDCLQIGNTQYTTHVQMVMSYDPEAQILRTADYGQPGGALREHRVKLQRGGLGVRLYVGTRPLMRAMSLASLGLPAEPAQLPSPVFAELNRRIA